MRPLYAVPLAITVAGTTGLAYAAGYEVRSFRLRRVAIPVLPRGSRPLRMLHISDIHMVPGQHKKQEWLRRLAALQPDFVINTGDNLSHTQGVPAVLESLAPLMERPGAYVFGSNDYYSQVFKNPARYLWIRDGRRRMPDQPMNPWEELRDGFDAAGWVDLTNTRGRLKVDGREIELVGVDDPHIGRDRYDDVAGLPDPAADISIGVTHAPYLRVLDRMTADGLPLILAGHTHGGQLCVPFYGALVTNCDLDRGRAKGLSQHAAGGREAFLHVSAGCGTSRYAPVRFACPPEATLMTLTAVR